MTDEAPEIARKIPDTDGDILVNVTQERRCETWVSLSRGEEHIHMTLQALWGAYVIAQGFHGNVNWYRIINAARAGGEVAEK